MPLFQAVWWGALGLSVLVTVLMALLIMRRIVSERRKTADRKRSKELQPQVFDCLDHPENIDRLAATLSPHDARLIGRMVRGLVDSVSGDTREILIDLLQRFGVVRDEIDLLRSGTAAQRLQAVLALAFFETPDVIKALNFALYDRHIEVRIAAANALVAVGQPVDLDIVLNWFGNRKGSYPRSLRNLLCGLVARDPKAVAARLESAPEPALTTLIYALGHTQDFNIIPRLMQIGINHDSTDVRAETLRALGLIHHPAAAPAVSRGLVDDAWEVRTQAAIAAGRIGLTNVADSLAQLLDDAEWWVRFRAAEALSRLGKTGIALLTERGRGEGEGGRVARLVLAEMEAD